MHLVHFTEAGVRGSDLRLHRETTELPPTTPTTPTTTAKIFLLQST